MNNSTLPNNSPLPWVNVNTGEVGGIDYPDSMPIYPTQTWQIVQIGGHTFKLNSATGESWIYSLGRWETVKNREE